MDSWRASFNPQPHRYAKSGLFYVDYPAMPIFSHAINAVIWRDNVRYSC